MSDQEKRHDFSKGQLAAAAELRAAISAFPNATFVLQEGVGGAGKSELLQALWDMLASSGVVVVPDEESPTRYRAETGFKGPIVATGRAFGGCDSSTDKVIIVRGFAPGEIQTILGKEVANPQLLALVSTYCLGSLRLARSMAHLSMGLGSGTMAGTEYRKYLSRIAAQFLLDRIPAVYLQNEYPAIESLVWELFAKYVPDIVDPHIPNQVAIALYEMHTDGGLRIDRLLAVLGSDPEKNLGGFNPVSYILEGIEAGVPPHELDERLCGVVTRIKSIATPGPMDTGIVFPLYTFGTMANLYKAMALSNLEGFSGLYREPRIALVAACPRRGNERLILETALRFCIEHPLSFTIRKTALAIMAQARNPHARRAQFSVHSDQFYRKNEATGQEEHRFFGGVFTQMEGHLRLLSKGSSDTLFFLTGDHSRIPQVPSMLVALILESILQQLGCPYVVRYINRNYVYDPQTRTLSPCAQGDGDCI